jgi:hypothetical protein
MSWLPRHGSNRATSHASAAPVAAAMLAIVTLSCHAPAAPADGANAGTRSAAAREWPDEPAGLTMLSDRVWTELTGGQWNRRDSSADRIVQDSTVTEAPPTALEYVYAAGFTGGRAPATHYYSLNHMRELFVGMRWKVSDPWQGHSSLVNKIQFTYTTSSDVAMVMYGPKGGPYVVRVLPQWPEHTSGWLTPNASSTPVVPGRWYRLEWYLKYESRPGAGDGVIRWWIDGALAGDYSRLRFPADGGFSEYQISPTWGGVGDTKAETDYYRFQRSYLSGR